MSAVSRLPWKWVKKIYSTNSKQKEIEWVDYHIKSA